MKILLVFAHPDDETFAMGGTIAQLAKADNSITLICATKGEEGEVGEPPVTTKEKLGEVREQELRDAAEVIGISTIHFLGYRDATLKDVPSHELEEKVFALFLKEKPDLVFTFDKKGGSLHPDHIKISAVATAVFKKYLGKVTKKVRLYHTATPVSYIKKYKGTDLEYKAFGIVEGVQDEEITTIIDISDTYKIKDKAARMHRSQHKDWERFLKRAVVVDLNKEYFQLILENKF